METYKKGLAQVHSLLGDVEENLAKHLEYVDKARDLGIDILVFSRAIPNRASFKRFSL